MKDTSTEAIRKTVTVPLEPSAAFDLFAEEIDQWWPKGSHSLAARSGDGRRAHVRVDPRSGGKVIETLPDGTEEPWADIAHYIPGERLTLRWYVGRSPDEATLVDIRFTPVDAGTRVDLTHSGFGILGESSGAVSASYRTGWDQVLGQYLSWAPTMPAALAFGA